MDLMVRKGIRHYSAGERTVFLDVSTGRYSLLVGVLSLAFQRWCGRRTLANEDSGLLERLVDQRYLIPANADEPGSLIFGTDPVIPQEDLRPFMASTSLCLVGSAVFQRLSWKRRLRKWPLQRIMKVQEKLDRLSRSRNPAASVSVDQVVRAHQYADFLLGNHDLCLERTLALVATCRRNGIDAQITIAVQLNPFAAHAWAQHRGIILNERLDRARLFKPILAF